MNLYELRASVNEETQNYPMLGRAEASGDGVATSFSIAPPGRRVLNDGLLVYTGAGTGTMDYDSGVYTFTAAPADAADLRWDFNHIYWTETQVDHAINVAIQACFPEMYVIKGEDIEADGEETDFDLTTANVASVIRMDNESSSGGRTGIRCYRMELLDGALMFDRAPAEGTITVKLVCRPSWLSDVEDVMDLPDRAVGPVNSYAAYTLMTQKQAPRTYTDIVVNSLGVGTLSPRQLNDAGNAFLLRFQMEMQHLRMNPWKAR